MGARMASDCLETTHPSKNKIVKEIVRLGNYFGITLIHLFCRELDEMIDTTLRHEEWCQLSANKRIPQNDSVKLFL